MSSYYGFPAQNAQFASYMAAAAAATQTAGLSASNPTQAYQVAYPAPNQYNPQYTAMYSAAPIKTVTVVTSTSAVKPVQRAQGLYSNFVQPGQTPSNSGNGYDAAVMSAASNYTGSTSGEANPYPNYGYGTSTQSSAPARGGQSGRRPFWGKRHASAGGAPPSRASIYYCECCKISCAGPQTWQEHIAGSKHKKREALLQSGKDIAPPARAGTSFLKCAVCEITVTGSDAFVAHVNGAKHQKTIKVYQQMGKPVPSSEPVVVTPAQAAQTNIATAEKKGTLDKKIIGRVSGKGNTVLGTAKVAFVPAGQLHTIGAEEAATEAVASETAATETAGTSSTGETKTSQPAPRSSGTGILYLPNERDVAPVGAEYIEDIFGENGKLVSFKCKLCDCSFNDLFAKEMHLKGRRHRLAYKQKVDPTLNVEMKTNSYKNKRANAKGGIGTRYFNAQKMGGMPRHAVGGFDPYYSPPLPRLRPLFSPHQQSFGTSEQDNRYVISKHSIVYASQMELQAIQKLVLRSECALKLTSDQLLEDEVKKERERQESAPPPASTDDPAAPPPKWTPTQQQIQQMRQLRGVQRCGPLAKGLLIRGDSTVDLVVMCFEKPTLSLLEKVASHILGNLGSASSGTSNAETSLPQGDVELSDFQVNAVPEEALILISTVAKFPADDPANTATTNQSPAQTTQRKFECRVYLTSQTLGDDSSDAATDPSDMLPRSRCLDALAELRHAKFFQAKISPNTEAMIALRILRDLSRRVPTWNPFPQWALELLIEKCAATASVSLYAAQLLRRVFECIAAGILLPGGPGIFDPCEREPNDAASSLNEQQREDITASAQHALRLVAFGLIWKVLGVERVSQFTQLTPHRSGMKRKAIDDPSPIGAKTAAVSVPDAEVTPMVQS